MGILLAIEVLFLPLTRLPVQILGVLGLLFRRPVLGFGREGRGMDHDQPHVGLANLSRGVRVRLLIGSA